MEAYTRLAAEKEKARPQEEAERREGLLNETSFDRRRQLAVYRKDGKRGHHMQVGPWWKGPHTYVTLSTLVSSNVGGCLHSTVRRLWQCLVYRRCSQPRRSNLIHCRLLCYLK